MHWYEHKNIVDFLEEGYDRDKHINNNNYHDPIAVVLDRAIKNLLSQYNEESISQSLQRITGRRLIKRRQRRAG